jgi:hypothetical protein
VAQPPLAACLTRLLGQRRILPSSVMHPVDQGNLRRFPLRQAQRRGSRPPPLRRSI